MGKTLKTILVLVVVVALVVVAQPHLAALLATTLSVSAATAAALAAMVIAVTASVVSQLIMGKPKALPSAIFDRLNVSTVPTAPRKIIFGKTAAGSDVRYSEKVAKGSMIASGGGMGDSPSQKGDYFFSVIALASHKVNAVLTVTLDDELSYTGGSTTGKFASSDGLKITSIAEGTSGNAAAMGSGSYWTSTARFTGCAYLKMRQRLDATIYPNGLPSRFTAVVEGCPVYDPRLDSTNGGSGSHRPDDQTTWRYYNSADEIGRNSALCLLTYILGWKVGGKAMWGMGVPASRINLANFITYANVCDESVATKAGGTVKRYQCDGIFSTADTHETIINAICASMGTARMVDTCGVYQLVAGFDDLDGPIYAFNEDDLIAQYEWHPSVAIQQRYNIARGRFANPDKLYQLEDFGEVSVAPLADGIPRPVVIELAAVSRAESCQRIARQNLVRNAYSGTFHSVFGPKAFSVQLGSVISLTIAKEGWNAKLFRVIDQSEEADLIFQMTLQEENAAIYAWDETEAVDLPGVIRPPSYDPNHTVAVASLAATSATETSSSGGLISRITVTWTAPDAAVSAISIEHSTDGVLWSQTAPRFDPTAEQYIFNSPVSGISTQIRARYRMFSGILGPIATTTVTAAAGSDSSGIVAYLTDESVTFAADSGGTIL